MKKWWKLAFLLFANFDNKEWVSWLQLMFHIKWWVFLIIKKSCFHIYNTFECHFKPNQKSRSDMTDPVGEGKVRFSTIGCTETKCWWTIQTAFFFLSKAKVLAKLSAFSISSTFIRQVFSAWASIFEIVSVTENLLSQTGRVISDVSVPCFAGGQRNDFKESTEYLSEYNLYY